MRKASSNKRAALLAEMAALRTMPDDQIDTSDIPPIREWVGWKRGVFYRPVKEQITLRLDADILAWFRKQAPGGAGYQTEINRALRQLVARRRRKAG